jgi:hypothetical protein
MRRRRVKAPDGTTWTVGRSWLGRPWPRARWRLGRDADGLSWMPDLDFGDELGAIFLVLALVLVVILFVVFVVPLLVLAIEVAVAIVLVAAGAVGRVLLRRPWVIAARPNTATIPARAWKVTGWRQSSQVIDDVRTDLAAGRLDTRPLGAETLY